MTMPSTPWRDILLPASFNGAPFHVESGGKTSGRRIVVHEFPKNDTPYAEDMGKQATRFQLSAYIIGPYYFIERELLIAACEAEGPGLLIHPSMGAMMVACMGYSVTEDRQKGGMATFSLEFVQSGEDPFSSLIDAAASIVIGAASTLSSVASSALSKVL